MTAAAAPLEYRAPIERDDGARHDPGLEAEYFSSLIPMSGAATPDHMVPPTDLADPKFQAVMQTITNMIEDGVSVDHYTLTQRLENSGVLSTRQIAYVMDAISSAPMSLDLKPMAARLRDVARGRRARFELARAADLAGAGRFNEAREAYKAAERDLEPPDVGGFKWRVASDIFAPLPPTPWVCKGLQWAPGRPDLLAGYSSSAKTLAVQAAALAIASGCAVWGRFECVRGAVRHVDYEQGHAATARRYQRLALGMGLEPIDFESTLQMVSFPKRYLTDADSFDAWTKAADGASMVIVDSLRAACPGVEENSSEIRVYLDTLTRVSEKTGCTFLVLHHAGKPNQNGGDARMALRGSSAIFDAAGCVLLLSNQGQGEPRKATQVKTPADAQGGAVDDFLLAIEDVPTEHPAETAVRVVYRPTESGNSDEITEAALARDGERILDVLRSHPGSSTNEIRERARIQKQRVAAVLEMLDRQGKATQVPRIGRGGGKEWRVT